jgi:hypothetical protein
MRRMTAARQKVLIGVGRFGIYIRLKIKPNSVRIRFLSCQNKILSRKVLAKLITSP